MLSTLTTTILVEFTDTICAQFLPQNKQHVCKLPDSLLLEIWKTWPALSELSVVADLSFSISHNFLFKQFQGVFWNFLNFASSIFGTFSIRNHASTAQRLPEQQPYVFCVLRPSKNFLENVAIRLFANNLKFWCSKCQAKHDNAEQQAQTRTT